MTLVFLPSCDNIPIAQNKMRNCRRKYDFHYVTGFRCSCGSCNEAITKTILYSTRLQKTGYSIPG